ncbi:hypothetical protein [Streptomyces sp. NBC_00078]|uniref:hypothetical protein n=1 Tax=unclassified Streptomyces TaxID=2593676 RepID=UPI002B1D3757|nr:hypothetical protein [Streptomyces sp. NBC_00078]
MSMSAASHAGLGQPLVDGQVLPAGCARSAAMAVPCRAGAPAADDVGGRIGLGGRSEVLLEIDTAWSGGAVDRNRQSDQERVLVLDTGDAYCFWGASRRSARRRRRGARHGRERA